MRKRNLLFPLFLGSLFIASNVDSAVFDLYEKRNNNILIAGSDCGGPSGGTSVQKKRENNLKRAEKSLQYFKSKKVEAELKGESTEEIDKKIEKYIKKINQLTPKKERVKPPENFKNLDREKLSKIKKKTDSMMQEIWEPYKRIAEENKRRKESGEYNNEDGLYVELLGLSPRSFNFTTAALDSQEDGNEARAETYHKLAIKSLESSLNKNEVNSSEDHYHHELLAINYYYLDDYENSNKSLRKAASGYKKTEKRDSIKTLVATTAILSGNVNQGCQDLYDYFADGDIIFDSSFPIEDFCIFNEEKF
ncbi:MAG: hypothetical protein JJ844_07080 [Prochlorococcus marinus CUG1435]|nr:hypothetical protein [Prochlorococcus marinus CUG1435]